jgi:hypothetical protein
MHVFVLSFSHLYLLVCVRWVPSLLLICNVFCIHGFATSSCMVNISLASIMTCNPAYTLIIIFITFVLSVGRGSSVGIVNGYGLEVQCSNPCVGQIFCSCPDRPWGQSSLPYIVYRVFPEGKTGGHRFDHPPTSRAEVKEKVGLCISNPILGHCGLYCTLTVTIMLFQLFLYTVPSSVGYLKNLCLWISWLSFLYICCNKFVVVVFFITGSCIF